MVGLAVGKMGMSLADVYRLDMEELGDILKAWAEREETLYRDRWERTRFLAHCLLSPYQKKGKKLKPADIARFPWDAGQEKEQAKAPSLEEIERMSKRFGA